MIARIENTFLRRLALIIAVPVVVLLGAVVGAGEALATATNRFSAIWSGRKPRDFSGRWVPA